MSPIQIADIFHGVTPAEVRNYYGEVLRDAQPDRVYHPCVGRFGALTAGVRTGLPADRNWSSDLNLYTSVIGSLVDPERSLAELKLKPDDEVAPFFDGADVADQLDYAARVLVAMKFVQLQPTNRYVEGLRRELRLRPEAHCESVAKRLETTVEAIRGAHYRVANLWDVLAELEAEPPQNALLYMSMTWYEGDFSKQLAASEAAFGWPGLVGREFNPENLTELLDRANAIPNMRVLAHVGDAIADQVPDDYRAVVAYDVGRTGKVDRLFSNRPLPAYAPQRIRRPAPRPVKLWTDAHDLTPESKLELVPIDEDTALWIRDLYVHRLGTSRADDYFALTLDGHVVTAIGVMMGSAMGAGGGDDVGWVREQFGVSVTSSKYTRFNRLAPMAITCGQTKSLFIAKWPSLQVRDVQGIQSTDLRHYNDSKVKRGPFKGHHKEKLPTGLWRIVTRGPFRDDTWDEVYAAWWAKWNPDEVRRRQEVERERKHEREERDRSEAGSPA